METDLTGTYRLYREFDDDNDNPFTGDDIDAESTRNANGKKSLSCSLCFSQFNYATTSFQSTIVCGILFGLFASFQWWISINISPSCFVEWHDIPSKMRRISLISDAVKAVVIMFWPILTIAPICSWSMIKDSNLLFLSIIAGFLNAIQRLFLYVFSHYEARWKLYIGNILFSLMVFIALYKFAKYRQERRHSTNNDNRLMITLKLSTQVILGLVLFLPFNYVIITYYRNLTPIERVIMLCSIIAAFFVPKLIISNVITSLHGLYRPNESIVFTTGFLIISTMIPRLLQAGIESLTFFIIVSLVNSSLNVIMLPVTNKLCKFIHRRTNNCPNERLECTQHYAAHQSLINMITETTSVIMSNAAAYLLVYFYTKMELLEKRQDGWIHFKDILIRTSIAISIEWFFNMISLKIQNDWCDIPVLRSWKREWKFILILILIQIIFVLYFADYANKMFIDDMFRNSTHNCIGLFRLL